MPRRIWCSDFTRAARVPLCQIRSAKFSETHPLFEIPALKTSKSGLTSCKFHRCPFLMMHRLGCYNGAFHTTFYHIKQSHDIVYVTVDTDDVLKLSICDWSLRWTTEKKKQHFSLGILDCVPFRRSGVSRQNSIIQIVIPVKSTIMKISVWFYVRTMYCYPKRTVCLELIKMTNLLP